MWRTDDSNERSSIFGLRIDNFTPRTIPMARLAEYMADFAAMLGSEEHGRFVRLARGSANIVARYPLTQRRRILEHALSFHTANADRKVVEAFRSIDERLRADNCSADIVELDRIVNPQELTVVVRFPGAEANAPVEWPTVAETMSLQGVVQMVGGKNDPVPVHLSDGHRTYNCYASRDLARQLAQHLFGATLRVDGRGKWRFDGKDRWYLEQFSITCFSPIQEDDLRTALQGIQQLIGPGHEDAITAILAEREH